MTRHKLLAGSVAIGMAAMVGGAALAQDFSALDRALRRPNDLIDGFNELVASTANIAPPSQNADGDRAKAQEIRALLQDPANVGHAADPSLRAAAASSPAMQRIPDLAARLDQGIGTRLSQDARTGLVRDFQSVAEFIAIVNPNDAWYCEIHGIGALVGC